MIRLQPCRGAAARRYHADSKNSRLNLRANLGAADPYNRPTFQKAYDVELTTTSTPTELIPVPVSTLTALRSRVADAGTGGSKLDLASLARLCTFSNGIFNPEAAIRNKPVHRAAACTGGLNHLELYIVCGDLAGLRAGVHHFNALDGTFEQLRVGDFRKWLAAACGNRVVVARAEAVLIVTSVPWRNAWKYRARAYRHVFWDAGTALANLVAVSNALDLRTQISLGFVDDIVNRLAGLDPGQEVAVALVPIGETAHDPPSSPPLAPLCVPTVAPSACPAVVPAIRTVQKASALSSDQEVVDWLAACRSGSRTPRIAPTGQTFALLRRGSGVRFSSESVESVIRRRRSARHLSRSPLSYGELSTLLWIALEPVDNDFSRPGWWDLAELYLSVHAVGGLPSGNYVVHRSGAVELLKRGDFREATGLLALGQHIAADAAINIYVLADLAATLDRLGDRGYGAAQLSAGLIAGRVYLAATAMGLGVSGLTFYDDEVIEMFSPQAAHCSVLFLLAVGPLAP